MRKIRGRLRKRKEKLVIKYKGNGKLVPGTNSPKINVSANSDCYFNSKGHWKRNCPKYLGDMKFENVSKVSVSSIYVIEINVATSLNDWVLYTGSCAHICTNMHALRNKRKLRNKEVQLRVGNGARVAAVTVGRIKLYLPNGLAK